MVFLNYNKNNLLSKEQKIYHIYKVKIVLLNYYLK